MLECVKVKMPEKGCVINANNKKRIPYVYYATRYYRNEQGKSITDRVLIGKQDPVTGMLIPNDNYFGLFGCKVTVVHEKGEK